MRQHTPGSSTLQAALLRIDAHAPATINPVLLIEPDRSSLWDKLLVLGLLAALIILGILAR